MIEKVDFELGQIVHLVLNPVTKGQVTQKTLFTDGGCLYKISYLNSEGEIREGNFYACELETDEEL